MTAHPTPHASWQYNLEENAYTLIVGEVHCRVWYSTIGGWAAVIRRSGIATASYNFVTHTEAKAWCEQQMAAQR